METPPATSTDLNPNLAPGQTPVAVTQTPAPAEPEPGPIPEPTPTRREYSIWELLRHPADDSPDGVSPDSDPTSSVLTSPRLTVWPD